MTLRMPTWEAERLANVLEYARMLTATDPKMKPWMRDCAARIRAAAKAESERRKRKDH